MYFFNTDIHQYRNVCLLILIYIHKYHSNTTLVVTHFNHNKGTIHSFIIFENFRQSQFLEKYTLQVTYTGMNSHQIISTMKRQYKRYLVRSILTRNLPHHVVSHSTSHDINTHL